MSTPLPEPAIRAETTLSADLARRVQEQASAEGRSVAAWVRRAIIAALSRTVEPA